MLDTRAIVRTRLIHGSQSLLPVLAVSCSDTELLDWLGSITDVRAFATTRGYDKHRCLEHCSRPHEHITSTSGRWSVTGAKATVVLCATRQWIRFQQDEWDRLIGLGVAADRKEATVARMAALGWPLPIAWTAL